MYLKRQSGLIKLYAAVMVTKPRASDGNVHPFGIEHGWRWLNNILNLEPLPDICATLILGFLQTAGFEMLRIYRNQFLKLLRTLQNQYMQRLSKVSTKPGFFAFIIANECFFTHYRLTKAALRRDLKCFL